MTAEIRETAEPRSAYHHGSLRTALIDATMKILATKRVEDFSVADAARALQVSSGAPYRHFKDRDDLLSHVAARGFEELAEATDRAGSRHPDGSLEGLIAAGCAYASFVASRPELFHLMWGAERARTEHDVLLRDAVTCYDQFIAKLRQVMDAHGLGHLQADEFGGPVWAMVHGFGSLLMGRTERTEADMQAIYRQIDEAARAYFLGRVAMERSAKADA
ncbi:MAG: TetR/AcrR family transcriptional regulator [Pseudomonadota bacterium]